MKRELMLRYIYAVVRHLPADKRDDVRIDLDRRINEKLHARNDDNMQAVLAEMGNPNEIALEYCETTPREGLISGIYYLMYRRVLLLVLPIVASVVTVASIIGIVTDQYVIILPFFRLGTGALFTAQGLQFITAVVGSVVQAFIIISLVFIVLNKKQVQLSSENFLADLPELPEHERPVSVSASVVEMVISISLTTLFVVYPHIMGLRSEGVWIPIFDTALLRSLWLPFLVWCALEVGMEILKLAEGRYTMRLAGAAVLAGIGCAVCAFIVFGGASLANPDFVYYVQGLAYDFPVFDGALGNAIINPQRVALVIMLAVIFFETLEVVIKAFQSRR
ncbi:MAG: hypothetical protein FWC16_14300 [Defluviitaleaceae bacterium]|nr:hypothetical protein [Defluviitaleaceae bacterium]MCL2276085.1 hypothetical protein [Defluviitaleaceae bacterium]